MFAGEFDSLLDQPNEFMESRNEVDAIFSLLQALFSHGDHPSPHRIPFTGPPAKPDSSVEVCKPC